MTLPHNPYRALAEGLKADWRAIARPSQLPPPGNWFIWLLMAGRGFGKTRVLSQWVLEQVDAGMKRIAVVGATAGDCRDILVEGESGILACAPRNNMPEYEPSKRRLSWKNGAIATMFSADEPDRLRGPNHDAAIVDELAAWRYPEAWEMLLFTLRKGKNPRVVIATTPKPTKLIKELVAREGKKGPDGNVEVVITRGGTRENEKNLAPQFLRTIVKQFEGRRLGRQELEGELLLDTPGALWNVDLLESTRVPVVPPLQRIVVAVDPSGSGGENADEAGIIVAGLGRDSEGYVLADYSGRMEPVDWARKAVSAYHAFKADRIVAEINFGGNTVIATIAAIDPSIPVKAITSSRGKVLRAEPISAFFEQRRAHLVGSYPVLEDQMTSFTADYDRARDGSPDRVDAMVFALSELMSSAAPGSYFNNAALLIEGEPDEVPACTQEVFGVLSTTQRTGSAVGLVILARSPNDVPPRLHIIDWMIAELDQALTVEWLAAAYSRVKKLAIEWNALSGPAQIMVEADEFGLAAFDICEWHYAATNSAINLCKIERRRGVPIPTLGALAESNRAKINSGAVKMARPAFERQEPFRATNTNHFTTQLLTFRPEAPEQPAELMAALCTGVGLWEGGVAFDASSVPTQPAEPAMPPPEPPPPGLLLPPGQHVIDGELVTVPAHGDDDLTFVHLSLGRHLVNSKITYIRDPNAGMKVGFNIT